MQVTLCESISCFQIQEILRTGSKNLETDTEFIENSKSLLNYMNRDIKENH